MCKIRMCEARRRDIGEGGGETSGRNGGHRKETACRTGSCHLNLENLLFIPLGCKLPKGI